MGVTDGPIRGERFDEGGREAVLGELYAHYVDRLNCGETLDPKAILAAHPEVGPELLEMLECFIAPDPELRPPPARLGDFTLARRLGRGGMGVVYDAWQHSVNRRVAVKVLPAAVAADPRASTRFMREAQAAGRLNHPNVVHVHGLGIEEDTPYYVMEYVEGDTLSQVIARVREAAPGEETPLGPKGTATYFDRVARLFSGVASGLHHAHSKGVVHRDIKPSNLILDRGDRLRILDFGLARLEGREALTVSGDFLGTPAYMSPEQALRKKIEVDHRTDIYSLGATMYETLCGRPPFQGKDHADTISQIIERDPLPPRRIDPKIPEDLETIVLKCLRKEAAERYSTAEALAQDLARFVKREPIEAKPEGRWARWARKARRNRTRFLVAGAALAALVAVVWLGVSVLQVRRERELALYPARLRSAVAKLDSGAWVLRFAAPPLSGPGIDFRIFEPSDFRNVLDIAGRGTVMEAVEDLEQLARSCPDEAETYYHLARGKAAVGRVREAMKDLDRALELAPGFGAAANLKANLAKAEGGVAGIARSGPRGSARDRAAAEAPGDWIVLWNEAERLRRAGEPERAERVLSELIRRFETGPPPYTGFLTECYLARAATRLTLERFDLAEEDCVRARADNPSSLAAELLLAKAYLSAGKAAAAEEAFRRLESHAEIAGVLPFWVVSVHLSVPRSDPAEALAWVRRVRDRALRERLAAYLYLRLGRWDEAVAASERAVQAEPDGVVPHQLLASALLKRAAQLREPVADPVRLADACRRALEVDPENRRSRYLVRAAWEVLGLAARAGSEDTAELDRALGALGAAARAAGLELRAAGGPRTIVEDFTADRRITDGRPLTWRLVEECCPGEAAVTPGGLALAKDDPERPFDAWLVTEEVFAGDVSVRIRADLGESRVFCNAFVDLGTASLYYAGVFRNGRCELGRYEYGREIEEVASRLEALSGDVFIELRSHGDRVEARMWSQGSERPEQATLALPRRPGIRVGAAGISTSSRPAVFRWVRIESPPPSPAAALRASGPHTVRSPSAGERR